MRMRRSGAAWLIACAMAVLTAITLIANALTGRLLASAHDGDYKLMQDALESTLKETSERALSRAEMVAAMPGVRAPFLANDRTKLREQCAKMFEVQSAKYAVDQAQFHVAPGISFLRLHETTFGEDERGRAIIADVHANHMARSGVAITSDGPAFLGVAPIADDAGSFAGSFEMGLEMAPQLDLLKASFGIDVAVFLDEKILRETATDLKGDIITPKNRVGKFIRFHATNPALLTAIITDRDVDVSQPTRLERTFADTPWGVELVPLYDYANNPIGVIALASSFGVDKANAHRARAWQGLAAVLGLLFLSGVTLVIVRGVVLGPISALGERLALLADGRECPPADPLDSYCDEVRGLAESYERLRARDARPEKPT